MKTLKKIKFKNFWTFINKPFSVFIFSAIFITFVPILLTNIYNNNINKRNKYIKIKMIDLELSYRLRNIKKLSNYENIDDIINKLIYFRVGPILFPEFKERSSETLIYELSYLVPEKEKPEIDKAFRATVLIPDIVDSLKNKKIFNISFTINNNINQFNRLSVLDRLNIIDLYDIIRDIATEDTTISKIKKDFMNEYGIILSFIKKKENEKILKDALSNINIKRWQNLSLSEN